MATYLDLITQLLKYTEKIPYAQATTDQIEMALRDLNDAVRLTWNYGDMSFKTVIKRAFVYTVQTNLALSARGTPLPADFMGFHQTGKVYLENNLGLGPLKYLSYQRIMDLTEGTLSTSRGTPTHYGLGGPSDPASALNQRELLLWPTPNTATVSLKLIYQAVCPADLVYNSGNPSLLEVQVPRIPQTWHIPVVLGIAKRLRKMDKGADDSAYAALAKTCIGQMNVQEPHGRERAGHNPLNRAWRG